VRSFASFALRLRRAWISRWRMRDMERWKEDGEQYCRCRGKGKGDGRKYSQKHTCSLLTLAIHRCIDCSPWRYLIPPSIPVSSPDALPLSRSPDHSSR
jgi:hypothetical protein